MSSSYLWYKVSESISVFWGRMSRKEWCLRLCAVTFPHPQVWVPGTCVLISRVFSKQDGGWMCQGWAMFNAVSESSHMGVNGREQAVLTGCTLWVKSPESSSQTVNASNLVAVSTGLCKRPVLPFPWCMWVLKSIFLFLSLARNSNQEWRNIFF